MNQAPSRSGHRAAAMPFILITVLIDMIAIGLIVPVLPVIVGTFTASPAEQTFWFAVVSFAFGIANFFGAPVLGALSDRYGRRPVLLIGFSGLALSFIVTGLATALWMLIAVRLVSGAMQANAAVANAYVADITPAAERARRFGLLGAMFGVGFTLGPVMGGLLGASDVRLPFGGRLGALGAFSLVDERAHPRDVAIRHRLGERPRTRDQRGAIPFAHPRRYPAEGGYPQADQLIEHGAAGVGELELRRTPIGR